MDYARQRGYPVPAVEGVSSDGTDLVMERVQGPSMVEAIGRQPWAVRHHGAVLAGLHHRLHEIPAPPWLSPAPCGDGDRLVHLDLHPLNVIMGANGPVVIDWTSASSGDGNVDVALAWVLMTSGQIPLGRVKAAVLGRGRALLVSGFLRKCDVAAVRLLLPSVVDWKVKDPNMSDAERQGMLHLARRQGAN